MVNQVIETLDATGATAAITAKSSDLGRNMAISINGISGDVIDLERRVDGTNWRAVETYTADAEENVVVLPGAEYRLNKTTHSSDVDVFLGYPI